MNRRRIGFILIGAGVIIALLVGVLVFLQANEAEQLRQAAPKRWVAVAGGDIPERTTITGDQVKVILMPDDGVPPAAASFLRTLPERYSAAGTRRAERGSSKTSVPSCRRASGSSTPRCAR